MRPANGAAPTLDEVARVAGVSRATASRAINGGDRVSRAAQLAVESAVRSLGYTPNPAARSLVTRRTGSVAVVVPEPNDRVFSDPFFAGTLRGVSHVLGQHDLQLVLLMAPPGADSERTLRYLGARHVDGAIITSHHRDDHLADRLADMGLPCVFGGRPWSGADRVAFVDIDQVHGGRVAGETLVARGCRRIGTVAGPADMTAGADRLQGFQEAMRQAGLPDDLVAFGDFTEPGGAQAARELLAEHADIDGLMVASDLMASGALQVLSGLGRRVPDDVALVGFDDFGDAERTRPTLTTMRNPVVEMAEQATRMLLQQISGVQSGPLRVILPTQLVRRESC